ncbi:glycoside hydrolase family 2 TIM barrel-domain containing protein [Gayadomonas joobiniege]|uniref:glycoside hydrolase family 2 TIM barrel-domain containing protein n=1 Tax=Gayadomonas joobiniege TaxID=1234606 RepID=UPI00037D285D|nr:glycoside hydrolase family 2 TIM barrel-domain containing protein [Gayadomonas joobiniege]
MRLTGLSVRVFGVFFFFITGVLYAKSAHQAIDFNFNWRFIQQNIEGAQQRNFDDSHWQTVRLPHDWSILSPYSQTNTAGATGYLPGGEGWYRKAFNTPKLNGKPAAKVQILFDGIYNHSQIWLNGYKLAERPSGYAPFYLDLTPYLTQDGSQNQLAIYVDRTRYVDSRWYTGSGIYRNVKLLVNNKIHMPVWSTRITTVDANPKSSQIRLEQAVVNDSDLTQAVKFETTILDAQGQTLATKNTVVDIVAGDERVVEQDFNLNKAKLWSPAEPNLYWLQTKIYNKGQLVDSKKTRFGIRTFVNDPTKGFFINGQALKIKGVNLHHDAGLVGAAVPDDVWRRRLLKLKEAGVNTIRTAHNPASKAFLNLCDEIGFLVQEEIFDEWDNPKDKRKNFNQQGAVDYITQSYNIDFAQWAEQDLKNTVRRDLNHASIFQWSIGNEIEWTYNRYTSAAGYWDKNNKVNYYWDAPPYTPEQSKQVFAEQAIKGPQLANTAKRLAAWVKEVDKSRPVTANLVIPSVSHHSGYTDALDVIGYSYRQSVYEYGRQHYPEKMILGTENWVQWHEWKAVLDKPYIAGIMLWTGISYLGESNGDWPKKGSSSGMLDFAGFERPSFHMIKSLWDEQPHLYMATQTLTDSLYKLEQNQLVEKEPGQWKKRKWGWHALNPHWNYQPGLDTVVEVYTNQAAVELFLNGQSMGIQQLSEQPDRILKWHLPFAAGRLTAKVVNSEQSVSLQTASEPVAVKLTADTKTLNNNHYDVAHITAQLIDINGQPVRHKDTEIEFLVNDQLRFLGTDNGAVDNIQSHQSSSIKTHQGKALLLVQSQNQTGSFNIAVKLKNKIVDKIQIDVVK